LWDNIFENAINYAIEQSTKQFDGMRFKQALKFAFFELQNLKEDYLIAKQGKANPYILMKFIETLLVLTNPFIPHFNQYCWNKYVFPVLSKCENYDGAVNSNLTKQPWPKAGPFDKIVAQRLSFLKDVKGAIRLGFDKAKTGGKKKGKKGAAPAEAKVIEKCYVFCAKEYPEFQKKCLTILQGFEFDENNKPVGDYIAAIRGAFDKKQAGIAMKFVSFQLNIAEQAGKDEGLRLEASFDEQECVEVNKAFLFENMPAIKEVFVMQNNSEEAKAIEGTEQTREAATPSKPAIYFC